METNLAEKREGPLTANQPRVFDYMDYRRFLKDFYLYKKGSSSSFSYRSFSRLAGLRSSNFFKFVMDGKRNLSLSGIYRFASALSLKTEEIRFFTDLVLFDQAESEKERNHYYEQILQASQVAKAKPAGGPTVIVCAQCQRSLDEDLR